MNRISGLSYGGRSMADWDAINRERQIARVVETAKALYSLFPPCHHDRVKDWANNGRKLGLLTDTDVILMMAYSDLLACDFPELRA